VLYISNIAAAQTSVVDLFIHVVNSRISLVIRTHPDQLVEMPLTGFTQTLAVAALAPIGQSAGPVTPLLSFPRNFFFKFRLN